MRKWIGWGSFYCTRCGARLLQGSDICPRCGRDATKPLRAADCPDAHTVTERDVLGSRAFRAYQRKNTFVKLLWAVALAMGVPWILVSTGQISFDETEGRVVVGVLCGMFLVIGVGSCATARRGREWRQKAAGEGKAGCVACGFTPDVNDGFCGKCGCAIVRTVTHRAPRKAEADVDTSRRACAASNDARMDISATSPTLEIDAPPDACVIISDEPPVNATPPLKAASSSSRRRATRPRAPATQSEPNSFACAPPTPERGKRPHAGVNLMIGLLFLVFIVCFILGVS